MHLNIMGFAVPLFIGLMLLEFFMIRKRKLKYSGLHDSIANISIGIAERLLDVFIAGVFYFVYDTIQKKYGLFHIKPGIFLWVLLLICTDFVWYWYHRFAHEMNILWAVHVVHHQSEDFNYTVSARITVLQAFVRTGFWMVLPLIGFPAPMIVSLLLVHGIYPFFTHTRLIGKLGVLECVFVTPSHHRVHHASDEKYLDTNYGDVFIIWDKLFGTFQKEEEEPNYGLTQPLHTYSFLWQHFHFFIEIFLTMKQKKTFSEKLKVLFARPDSIDKSIRSEAEKIFRVKRNPEAFKQPLNTYVLWQIGSILVLLFVFILFEQKFSLLFKISFTLFVFLTLINCGAIMEQKKWIFDIEFLRIVVLLIVPVVYFRDITEVIVIALLVAVMLSFYQTLKNTYLAIVYNSYNRKFCSE